MHGANMTIRQHFLALSCIISLRTRNGKLEKVLMIEDYSFKKGRSG